MQYPNKIYVVEETVKNPFGESGHFVIVIAASSSQIAKSHVKDQVGIDAEPTLLMSAVYPTIWTSDGSKPMPVQAKILSNSSVEIQNK